MAAKTERLLTAYKEYETYVRSAGLDPKALEGTMDERASGRMRMIRQFRNYLSHNHDPGFLEPTDSMLRYLETQLQAWQMQGDNVKKHIKHPTVCVCQDTDRVCEAVAKMLSLRKEHIVVQAKDAYVIYDLFTLMHIALTKPKSTKIKSVSPTKIKPVFVTPTAKMEDINTQDINICTSDGTAGGKLLGVVFV